MINGSLMKVERIAECSKREHSAILLTDIKRLFVLKTNFCLFEIGRLHRFYCSFGQFGLIGDPEMVSKPNKKSMMAETLNIIKLKWHILREKIVCVTCMSLI